MMIARGMPSGDGERAELDEAVDQDGLSADGGTYDYFFPWLTVTPPTDPAIFDESIYLSDWTNVSIDAAAELGTYVVRSTIQTHLGVLAGDIEFRVGGTTPAVFTVESTGDVLADGTFYASGFLSGSADVAEWVNVSELVEPGDVLELDPENPGQYRKARSECSSLVAGVVSTQPGVTLGFLPTTHHPLLCLH